MIHYSDIEFGYKFDNKFWAGLSLIAGHQMLSAEFTQLDYSSGENGEYLSYELFFEGKKVVIGKIMWIVSLRSIFTNYTIPMGVE